MALRRLLSYPYADRDRRVLIAVAAFIVVVTYAGVKFTLFAGRLLMLNGVAVGLVLGVFLDRREESVAAARYVTVLATGTIFVVFMLDDFGVASRFGVVPGLVSGDPGTTGARLVAFGIYEALIVSVIGAILLLTVFAGAWIGSHLRPFVLNEGW